MSDWCYLCLTNVDTESQKIQVTCPRDLKTCLADSSDLLVTKQHVTPPSTVPKTTAHAIQPRMCSAALLLISPD